MNMDTETKRLLRPQYGECPYCEAREDDWCAQSCAAIDRMDYR